MILSLALALALHGPATVAPATPSAPLPTDTPPVVAPSTTPLPTASAAPLPSPAPSPNPVPTPTATPTSSPYGYRFVPRQPAHPSVGEPQIFAVYLNTRNLRSRGPILIKVATSPDVVKVVSRSNGREGTLTLVAPGDFEATSVLPKIPFIAAGIGVDLEFIAIGPDGRRVSVRVPVTVG